MILEKKALTMAEVKDMTKGLEIKPELQDYLKKFTKLSKDKSDKLIKDISSLNNPKIKDAHAVKLADFLPTDREELGKIFNDGSLTEEESNAILDITKKYN